MGTQVHHKSYFADYYSMRDLNEDSNGGSWPLFYGDKTLTSGQYYNCYMQRTITDSCPGYDKDALKQKMLDHEAIFKKQVYELHRLYRIQKDMMEEIRRKELHKRQMSIEPSSSSSLLGSQMPSEDAGKWHMSSFPLANSGYPRPSMSGAEIVNSPLSGTKGNKAQAGQINGSTSKDCEVFEVRPSKMRKKLFDLQLPADEYIDTEEGEQVHDNKVANASSSLPNGNNKVAPENRENFFLNGTVGEKFDYQRDASTSESCFRRSMKVADLNEPVQVEDGIVPPSVDFCVNSANCGETKGLILSAKPSSDFLGLRNEIMQNANRGNQSGAPSTISVVSKGNEIDWLSGLHESDHRRNNFISISQGLQQDHQSAEVSLNEAHQPPATLPTNYGRDDLWRDRAGRGLEAPFNRIHGNFNNNHLESVVTGQIPSPHPFVNSSDFANSWSHSALSWAKPTGSITEKLSSFHAHPSLDSGTSLSKSSQSSAQSHGILGEKRQINGGSRLNPGVSDLSIMNGFYHGSSSGSKEMLARPVSFSHLNCNGIDNAVSGRPLNHRPEDLLKGSNYMDIKAAKDLDLNAVHSKSSSIEAVPCQDVEIINEKQEPENHLAVLPWLRSKPASKSEAINARKDTKSESSGFFKAPSNQLLQESEHVKDLSKKFTQKAVPLLSDSQNGAREMNEIQGIKKLLGFPIFEKPSTSRNDSSLPVSTSVTIHHPLSREKVDTDFRRRVIDINLACDEEMDSEAPTVEKTIDTKVAHIKNCIDLNSFVTEDEDPVATSVASNSACMKIVVDIDLEVPVQEIEDDIPPGEELKQHQASLQSLGTECEQTQGEVVRMAAEAIILLSSSSQHICTEKNTCQPPEDPLAEILLWFADVLTSSTDSQETKGGKEVKGTDGLVIGNYSSDEMDDFEVLTLQLQETKEEDYMPKPFFPEVQNMEESGTNSLPNRPRKGQTRRGRQRRDFQRDILPGLASLSRHEVTEDLQTFGGLMRATGHPWNSGLTRRNGTRNGGARGRLRTVVDTAPATVASASCTPLMQQLNNLESGLEDRSLTGWGKTTRRPRRQRCPAGNPPTVPLT